MTNSRNWALDRILVLDEVRPGLAGAFLRASDERRQVIAAYLSVTPTGRLVGDLEAALLATAAHDEILAVAFPQVPLGLRRTLARAGRKTHPRRFYVYLHALLMSKEGRVLLEILTDQPVIDLVRLRVVRSLPKSMRTPWLVAMHKDIDAARRTATIYRLMVGAGVDPDGLTQALQEVRTPGALTRCWRRWIERVNFPNPPVMHAGIYRPITTGAELRSVALRHRNCMRRYLCDVMEGSDAFAVFEHPEQELVLHLRLRERAWFLEGCHSKGNGPVVSAARSAATAFLADCGIEPFKRRRSPTGKWEPLRDLLARWELDEEIAHDWG